MKMTSKSFTTIIVLFEIVLVGCASTQIEHLSADEFVRKAQRIELMESAQWTTYIGATKKRVYLEFGTVIGFGGTPKTTVYWTEIEGLPLELAIQLKSGRPPWTPW